MSVWAFVEDFTKSDQMLNGIADLGTPSIDTAPTVDLNAFLRLQFHNAPINHNLCGVNLSFDSGGPWILVWDMMNHCGMCKFSCQKSNGVDRGQKAYQHQQQTHFPPHIQHRSKIKAWYKSPISSQITVSYRGLINLAHLILIYYTSCCYRFGAAAVVGGISRGCKHKMLNGEH